MYIGIGRFPIAKDPELKLLNPKTFKFRSADQIKKLQLDAEIPTEQKTKCSRDLNHENIKISISAAALDVEGEDLPSDF